MKKWIAIAGVMLVLSTACFPTKNPACPPGTTPVNGVCVSSQETPSKPAPTAQPIAPGAPAPTAAPPAPQPTTQPAAPTNIPSAPAPSAAPTQAPAPQGGDCLDGFAALMATAKTKFPGEEKLHDRVSELIELVNQAFNRNPRIGYEFKPGVTVDNPGSAGVAIVWTDTGDSASKIPTINPSAPGGLAANWIPLEGFAAKAKGGSSMTNGWGFWRLHTSATMQTSGRAARLCQGLTSVVRYFFFA